MKHLYKTLLWMVAACLMPASQAYGVPAKCGIAPVAQRDGTMLPVMAVGDEFGHGLTTEDGLMVARDGQGDYCYVLPSGITAVAAHAPARRTDAELAFVQAHAQALSWTGEERTARRGRLAASRVASTPSRATQVPQTGTPRVPILLVEYDDKKMSNTTHDLDAHYNQGDRSVLKYFTDQSNGLFAPQFDVYGIYTLPGKRADYGANDNRGMDVGVGTMVVDAILAAGGEIDWSRYDNDGDGAADVCIVVYAGVGEAQASRTVPDAVWPCQWTLSSAYYNGYSTQGEMTRNGVTINKFAVFNEVTGSMDDGTDLDGIGTFCHEFSHCLGLPDFYETTYAYGYYGLGSWSLMDYGCYNDDGNTPVGYSAYEKQFMGWIDLEEAREGNHYTLPVFNAGGALTDKALKITSPIHSNEYYVVENRARQGWDSYMAGEGVMISHYTYVSGRWSANTVNNKRVQLATIFPADGVLSNATESGDLYGHDNHELSDTTTPAAVLYMSSSGSVTGNEGYLDKPLSDIVINDDGTASLWFAKPEYVAVAPQWSRPIDVTSHSFTATWTDVTPDENVLGYTLRVTRDDVEPAYELVYSEDFGQGTTWTIGGSTTQDDGFLRLGTILGVGSVTSPTIDLRERGGTASVKVNVRPYADATDIVMRVSLLNLSNVEVNWWQDTLRAGYNDYVIVLNDSALATGKIKIANTEKSKRVLIKTAQVYQGDASELADALLRLTHVEGDERTQVISDITGKACRVENLTPGHGYYCRLKAHYSNGTESDWTLRELVTLADGSDALPGDVNGDGRVDVTDVNLLINIILGRATVTDCKGSVDVNGDGRIDVTDVNAVINIILDN